MIMEDSLCWLSDSRLPLLLVGRRNIMDGWMVDLFEFGGVSLVFLSKLGVYGVIC